MVLLKIKFLYTPDVINYYLLFMFMIMKFEYGDRP